MSYDSTTSYSKNLNPDWITIKEAIGLINSLSGRKLKEGDIYRLALQGKLRLSFYFQSPVFLRKIKATNHKLKLVPLESAFISRLCMLDKNAFLSGNYLRFSTEGEFIYSLHSVIDTNLLGYEFILIQHLLARSLKIPPPVTGASNNNYGITVSLLGETFQVFEKMTWQERIKKQVKRLPDEISDHYEKMILHNQEDQYHKDYFPIFELPRDACFVIRQAEVNTIINIPVESKSPQPSSTRISTPLSRLFWLACKNNESIRPLIDKPYKLLSIFEQWASAEGITDRFSGETLKTALERGSPTHSSSSELK
ncbi:MULTISPECIES: hypothetical protein [Citrobacter]|uniref:hypothetical protein n=1 Tax=Citrobacter TaxID=544 RepID=UPI000E3D0D86|nr:MULTISPECIES: hypothetical protein [Citrobacter]MBD0826556.1 hypothetical protein [Citrobacter sp. C1]RFU93284.1 hypothetical protein DZA29_01925 [Citrobacter gillenii]